MSMTHTALNCETEKLKMRRIEEWYFTGVAFTALRLLLYHSNSVTATSSFWGWFWVLYLPSSCSFPFTP